MQSFKENLYADTALSEATLCWCKFDAQYVAFMAESITSVVLIWFTGQILYFFASTMTSIRYNDLACRLTSSQGWLKLNALLVGYNVSVDKMKIDDIFLKSYRLSQGLLNQY